MNNYAKRNWTEYRKHLVNRGSVIFWFSKECLDHWISKRAKPGRPACSKEVILAGLIRKTGYNLPLRSLQSFFSSILRQLIDKSPKTVQKVFADGAYDRSSCRKDLFDKGLHGCILPRRQGTVRDEAELKSRNDSVQIIVI
jgi:hypothetical protein